MNKGYDTKEIKVVPLTGRGKNPFVIKWSVIYVSTAVLVTICVLLLNFMFVLYPRKVESYNLATSIDTSELLYRLSQVKAQATPELRIYSESSKLALANLSDFHRENVRLRRDNNLSEPVLSPADVTDPNLKLENASFRNPADIANELSAQTSKMMDSQKSLWYELPRLSQDSENIAWVKAHTPSRYPVANGENREISSGYGWRIHPIYRTPRMHDGIDFHGPPGEELYAVADGTVTKAGWFGGYGLMVIIQHRKQPKIETRYGHIIRKGLRVEVGDKVKRGDLIGLMGSTGVSTGTHVHFEVRINGKTTDPKDYVLEHWSCGGFPEPVSEDGNNE